MSNRRQGNEDVYTSRLTFRLDCYDNQGEYTSFKGEVIGNATELDRLFTKTLDELRVRIGSEEFPRTVLVRSTRSRDISPMGIYDEYSVF